MSLERRTHHGAKTDVGQWFNATIASADDHQIDFDSRALRRETGALIITGG